MGETGRVAIVTGAARGIGEAVARRLAEDGARVVVADLDERGAADTARSIANSVGMRVDVRDRASFAAAIERAVDELGRLDILVNNAALTIQRPFFEIDDAEWDD